MESAGKDRKTILIVGSSASMIRTLTVQLKVWASEHGFEESRIRGMWGANQHDEWNKNFLSNPNDDHELDVLLFTHFIQAGLSIENDSFFLKIMLYPISYIDHGIEYQLANRLRIPVPAFAYIEKGREDETEKNVKALTAKYQLINSYNWPFYQVETFAEVECEHRDTIYFHAQKWERRATAQKSFQFNSLPESDQALRIEEGKILDHHVECAQGVQKRIYNNLLFRSNNISIELYNTQDEIGRIIHWDAWESEKTIKSLTKHSEDPGKNSFNLDNDFKFIMAICNEKETPSITTPNLQRLVIQPHKLCRALDYLLSMSPSDADDYWRQHLTLAKKMERVAHALLIPNIVKVLPVMGIADPQILFHFLEDKLELEVEICQKTLVDSYLLEDPGFKNYNLVHDKEKITYNRLSKQYKWRKIKFSTPNLVKRFLIHLGLESVTCSIQNGKRAKPKYNESVKYKLGIPSSKRSFAIMSSVYDVHHWGNFQCFSDQFRHFIENGLQIYKDEIIEENLAKEREGEILGSQDTLMGDTEPMFTHDSPFGKLNN